MGKGSRARKRLVFPRWDRVHVQANVHVLPGEHQSLRQAPCGAGGAAPSHRRGGRGRRAGQGAPSRCAPDLRAPDVPRHHNNHFYYLLHGRHGPAQHFKRAPRLHCGACPHCGACSSTSTRRRCAVGKGSRARKRLVFPRWDRVHVQANVHVLPGEHQSLRQAQCGAGGAAPSHRRGGRGRRAGQGAPSRCAPDLRAPDVPRHHNNHFYYLLHGRHGPAQHFKRAPRLHCGACPHCGACSSTSTRLRSVAVCRMAEALEHLRHGR